MISRTFWQALVVLKQFFSGGVYGYSIGQPAFIVATVEENALLYEEGYSGGLAFGRRGRKMKQVIPLLIEYVDAVSFGHEGFDYLRITGNGRFLDRAQLPMIHLLDLIQRHSVHQSQSGGTAPL